MQIEFETNITNEWTPFSEITDVDVSATYYIQNRGGDTLVALESESLPDDAEQAGNLILPYQQVKYEKGSQNLYLRALNRICGINITKVD